MSGTTPSKLARLTALLPLILLVAALVTGIVLFLPFGGQPILSLVHNSDTSISNLVLEEVKDAYRINTVEYLYRVVFPYDFMSPEVPEFDLLRKLQSHLGQEPATYLSPVENEYLKILLLAKKYGLNLKKPDYHFLVATVTLIAGFDLADLEGRDWLQVSTGSNGLKTAVITLPKAKILDTRVEDPVRDNYPYPDVPLSPEGWKELSALLRDHAATLGLADGILDKAGKNVSGFLEKLLLNSGFSAVRFIGD